MSYIDNIDFSEVNVDVDEDGKMFIVEDLDYVGVEVHSDKSDKISESEDLGNE